MLKKYLITADITTLSQKLYDYTPEYVLYRDKETLEYVAKAQEFLKICSEFKDVKAFLHRDYRLAYELHAYGVHFTSKQFSEIQLAKKLGLKVIISAHTHQEVLDAELQGADYVTYSPIFASPNKGEPKGVKKLNELLNKTKIKVFALGGIVAAEQIEQIAKTQSYGFASIRYFK